jgi:hypothetical protein
VHKRRKGQGVMCEYVKRHVNSKRATTCSFRWFIVLKALFAGLL